MFKVSPQITHWSSRNARDLFRVVALSLLALAALPLLWNALERLNDLLRYPYPRDGLEGTLLYEARLLWSGAPLYQPLERSQFISAPYPPLHPLLLGFADHYLAGPHVFWGGRLVSLAAALAITMLIVLISRRAGGTWIGGLVGAAVFLSAPPVLLWATRIKPDMLALFWTTLGLFLATRLLTGEQSPQKQSRSTNHQTAYARRQRAAFGSWGIVAACFVLAFFTKQTAVAAPLATGLALLVSDVRAWHHSERVAYIRHLPLRWRTFVFAMTFAALALGVWLTLDLITGGQYSMHVWGLHRPEWWSVQLLSKFAALLAVYVPATLLAAALLFRAVRDQRVLVLACYALLAPITLLGAGETGANHNHLLETVLALVLVIGCAVGWLSSALRRGQLRALVLLVIIVAQISLAFRPPAWYRGELVPGDPPERYLAAIRATRGDVLADDIGLLVQAGRAPRYDDPSTMGPAARSGVWDQRGLIHEIAERRFQLILIPPDVERSMVDPSGRWSPEVLQAIRTHYRLQFNDTINSYVPK